MTAKLIQIIGYRESFDPSTSKTYFKTQHYKDIVVGSIVELFADLNRVISQIPEGERVNIHYTNANCDTPNGRDTPLRTFAYQEMIPLDLDGVDVSKEEAYTAIVKSICKVSMKDTGIFCSGNGLHYVIALDKRIQTIEELKDLQRYYKALVGELNVAIFEAGLAGHVDPVRLAESATLRLPETLNRKKGKEDTRSYTIQGNVKPQKFDLKTLIKIEEHEDIDKTKFNVDSKAVLAGCSFLKFCLENQTIVTEPQWHGMINTLVHIPSIGTNLCHTYSEQHSTYEYENTQSKIDQAIGFGKPRTCKGIANIFHGCNSCPYYGRVVTPLAIKSESFIATQDSGFHFATKNPKTGAITHKPDYDGLERFFAQKYPYIVDQETTRILQFTGKKWEEITNTAITSFATEHFSPTATNSMRSEFLGLVSNKHPAPLGFIDKDNEGYINFKNGVLRLEDRILLPHSPEFGFTYSLPYDYNPRATCPNFDKMMDSITLNDKDLQKVLLEFVGLAISGRPNSWVQKVMVLSGEGSNGKSTFMNIITNMVGKDCFSGVSLAAMSKENSRNQMHGKLFNISFDEDPKALLKGTTNVFKAISAGDPVEVKRLYANTFTASINSKLIVACNKPLETNDHTHAIYRRMLIIPFRATFEGVGDDKNVSKRIHLEMSGIYNRVLDGLDRLVENEGRFSDSKAVSMALEEYRYESAVFQRFYDDTYELTKDPAHFIAVEQLMFDFKKWCEINNERIDISSNKLCKELRSLKLLLGTAVSRRVNNCTKRVYFGIKELRSDF